jgi:hypothetical protein
MNNARIYHALTVKDHKNTENKIIYNVPYSIHKQIRLNMYFLQLKIKKKVP